MKKLICLIVMLCGLSALAFTNYVDLASTNPVSPFTSWANAATNIQEAIDAHNNDPGTVVATDGFYAITSGINLDNIDLKSLNGPENTIIDAGELSIVCVSASYGEMISGFTVQNGLLGIYNVGIVSNCVVQYNYNPNTVGTALSAGIRGGQVYDSIIRDNYSVGNGGGLRGAVAYDCVIEGNMSFEGYGGGAYDSYLERCYVANNSAIRGGGLTGSYNFSSTRDTVFLNNYASPQGGGAIYQVDAYNCTFINNDSSATESKVIMRNPADETSQIEAANCIFVNDYEMSQSEMLGDVNVRFSCGESLLHGALGNITNNPQFVEWSYRLSDESPCIDAGFNPNVSSETDKDGNPRIVGGTVDMGAYEWQTAESATILPVKVTLESSSDLTTWTNTGESVEWLMPADAASSFYRTRLEL